MRTGAFPIVLLLAAAAVTAGARPQESSDFRSGIELINVAAWVTDRSGRFVSGLHKEDFAVFEDGEPQEVAYFSSERVPVSLGLVLDASGSMTPDKMSAARSAIDRFVHDLLSTDDELFFLEFANRPDLVQGWTTDRAAISSAVARVRPAGGTAMYDAVADALFRQQETWSKDGSVDAVVDAVLTPEERKKLREIAKDPAILANIERDVQLGQRMKVGSTPTMIVTHDGKPNPVVGVVSYTVFSKYLNTIVGP